MISIEQIKAARSLLGWGQTNLAHAAGISLPALSNFERKAVTPRLRTIEAIQKALEKAGIEFIESAGVVLRREIFRTRIFEGPDAIFRVWDDIIETLRNSERKELLLSGADDALWMQKYEERLFKVIKERQALDIRMRLLTRHGDRNVIGSPDDFRWVPEVVWGQTPYYVYADKFAVINLEPPAKIVLIENPGIAATFRQQFEFNWTLGARVKTPHFLALTKPKVKERKS